MAHALHYWGPRAEQTTKVDLRAVPAEPMESELFGYERGAFTGARDSKPKLELAQGAPVPGSGKRARAGAARSCFGSLREAL
jgi:DNA-binding NtrC family response regulator